MPYTSLLIEADRLLVAAKGLQEGGRVKRQVGMIRSGINIPCVRRSMCNMSAVGPS
jgi:hypothetical protein